MLKVIVADDENKICRLICMLADWTALGMEVVATAANGLEALEEIKQHQPDILITDIHMPGCSGLELIAQAKALQPDLEIIIISGYNYFEYALSAIKHGVGEYLLKPIQQAELNESLRKLGQRCLQRQNSIAEVRNLKEDAQARISQRQEQFVRDLMNKQVEDLEAGAIQEQYQLQLDGDVLQVFVLKMDYAAGSVTDTSLEVIQEKNRSILNKLLSPLCQTFVMHFEKTEGCGIMRFDPQQSNNVRSALREAINQLTLRKPVEVPFSFSIGLGQAVSDTLMLPQSLKSARAAVMERILAGTGRLLEASRRSEINADSLLQHYRVSMGYALDRLDANAASSCVDQMEQDARNTPGMTGKSFYDLAAAAGRIFILHCNYPQQEELIAQYDLCCHQCNSIDTLFNQLRQLQNEQISRLQTERDNEEIRPIRQAKKYVQEHYREAITLEDVCVAVGFSASYFSVLFKKETGEGFAKYLTNVRIDKAKELLQETDSPVAEICREVGYSDVKHFVQTFRKATGLNPAQYRKLYG